MIIATPKTQQKCNRDDKKRVSDIAFVRYAKVVTEPQQSSFSA